MRIGRVAVGVVVALLLAIMFSCGQSDTEANLAEVAQENVALSSGPIEVIPVPDDVAVDSPILENKKEERADEYFSINLQLPILTGTRADAEINDLIQQDKIEKISEMEEWATYLKENPSVVEELVTVAKSELVSVWDYTEQDNIVSIIIAWDQYSGGAHDYYYNVIYTLNKDSGKVYSFPEIFSSSEGVDFVTQYIESEITNNPDIYMAYSLDDLAAYNGDYDYYVNGDTINVVFPPYDLQCFAAGITKYTFEVSDLKEWLKPEFISALEGKTPKEINCRVIYDEEE